MAIIYHKKENSTQTSLPYPQIIFIIGAVLLVLTFVFPVTDKIFIGTITLRSITFPISIMMMITAFYPALLIWGISLALVFFTYKTGANTPTGFEWAAVPNSTWIIILFGIGAIFGIKHLFKPVYKKNEYSKDWREEYRKNQTNNKFKG